MPSGTRQAPTYVAECQRPRKTSTLNLACQRLRSPKSHFFKSKTHTKTRVISLNNAADEKYCHKQKEISHKAVWALIVPNAECRCMVPKAEKNKHPSIQINFKISLTDLSFPINGFLMLYVNIYWTNLKIYFLGDKVTAKPFLVL